MSAALSVETVSRLSCRALPDTAPAARGRAGCLCRVSRGLVAARAGTGSGHLKIGNCLNGYTRNAKIDSSVSSRQSNAHLVVWEPVKCLRGPSLTCNQSGKLSFWHLGDGSLISDIDFYDAQWTMHDYNIMNAMIMTFQFKL
eukprot:6198330-Pleurochrysis_carterae.AAC.1